MTGKDLWTIAFLVPKLCALFLAFGVLITAWGTHIFNASPAPWLYVLGILFPPLGVFYGFLIWFGVH